MSGDPAWWQVVQSGALEFGEVPVTAWQVWQLLLKDVWLLTPVWAVPV
jgi:hypothetical protein